MVVPRITCVAGLPGSGKSTWLAAQSRLTGAKVFDDFKADAFNDDPAFAASRHITALKEVIAEGRSCFIADIDFCGSAARAEAVAFLSEHFNTPVSWVLSSVIQRLS